MPSQQAQFTTLDDFKISGVLSHTPSRSDRNCNICLERYTDPVQIKACGHVFDRECLMRWLAMGREEGGNCPQCRAPLLSPSRTQTTLLALLSSPEFDFDSFGLPLHPHTTPFPPDLPDLLFATDNFVSRILNLPALTTAVIDSALISRALILSGNITLELANIEGRALSDVERAEFGAMLRAMYAYVRGREGEVVEVRKLPGEIVQGTVMGMRAEGWETEGPMMILEGRGDGAGGRLLRMAFLAAWVTWRSGEDNGTE